MRLIDTSVWIDHLRTPNFQLTEWLITDQVLNHPFVTGELACGNLRDRKNFLSALARLPSAVVASNPEVLHLIEAGKLHRRGLGWIDAHLLASARLSGCRLQTRDVRLSQAALELGV